MSAAIEVIDPGLLSSIQDLGRPGFAHLGVPHSGAADRAALRLANRLVGNPETAAGIETTLTGCSFRVLEPVVMAVTGASCSIVAGDRPRAWGTAFQVDAGASVRIGPATAGARSYLALAGGIAAPDVLGSVAYDQLSGVGGPPLVAGDRLSLGPTAGVPRAGQAVPVPPPSELRISLGPREDWFTEESLLALDGARYVVTPASNRIGVRLSGPALVRRESRELPSEPVVLGGVQVPPNGQPVIFLCDHPTTGGYPVVGVVVEADLAGCAQLAPGAEVRFRVLGRR